MATLERLVARMFGFGLPGAELDEEGRTLLERGAGAVILFARNVVSARQVFELCGRIKGHAEGLGRRVPVGIDQEGGRVRRLREGFSDVPSMRAVGRVGDEKLAEAVGRVLGGEVRGVNVDIDFAPDVDVDSNPANPVIADRSFGGDPELVARMGVSVMRGIQSCGVAACAKHFPGHGDTSQDSHHQLPRLGHGMERLERVELRPFGAMVKAGVASVMTSHVVFEPLDREYPATMSRACIGGILRERMGFGGVVFSDDMEMKAIAEHYGLEQAVIRAANAGVDLLWICHSAARVHEGIDLLVRAVERGEVKRERVEEANRRMDGLCATYYRRGERFDASAIDAIESRRVVEEVKGRVGAALAGSGVDPTEFMKVGQK